jgi:hypothetical protein
MNTNRASAVRMAIAIATITLTAGIACAQTAAPVNSAMSISKVPFVITKPGLYLVKKDLVLASATSNAITVNASDVTIDLGGHVISSGAPQDANNQSTGISSTGTTSNLVIRNGAIRSFSDGTFITTGATGGTTLIENVVAANSGLNGIFASGDTVEIRGCHVLKTGYQSASNSTSGINAVGYDVKVTDNVIGGISTGVGSFALMVDATRSGLVEKNTVSATSTGTIGIYCFAHVAAAGVFAVENTITNFTTGLQFTGSAGGKYRGNLTVNCTTPFSGGTAVGGENN